MVRTVLAVAATAVLLAAGAFAQQPSAAAPAPAPTTPPPVDFSKVEIKTTDLGDGVYLLEDQGGNITVATAKGGIILVDGEFASLHDMIRAAIAVLSSQSVKYLINTHFHGDHTGGNAPFAKNGAKTPPAPAEALPTKTYTSALKIMMPGRVADLKHITNAHTNGDTHVWFKAAETKNPLIERILRRS